MRSFKTKLSGYSNGVGDGTRQVGRNACCRFSSFMCWFDAQGSVSLGAVLKAPISKCLVIYLYPKRCRQFSFSVRLSKQHEEVDPANEQVYKLTDITTTWRLKNFDDMRAASCPLISRSRYGRA